MIKNDLQGKKLLILGANAETTPLVEVANILGVKTIVTSYKSNDAAKKIAWKAYDVDGLDVPELILLAKEENVDGVLVGVADILVPAYCKVCEALALPCYATQKIVDIFSYKDRFKSTCETYGIHGIPEFYLDERLNPEDIENIKFPVMVKPVDSYSGLGMSVCYQKEDLKDAVKKAMKASREKRFIVEKYMQCDDMGIYYTFKDGYCSASCIYDRYTTDEQKGLSRVCLGGTYPSKHIDRYFERMHKNATRMFHDIGIRNGVLMLSAFYEDGEFYVYDTGFRLQGEAPHLLMKAVHGFDQREMLIRFALTGSEGDINLEKEDDSRFRAKWAATVWFLLKEGTIGKVDGFEEAEEDSKVVAIVKRFYQGDTVLRDWIGTEKQVIARMYIVCDSKEELAEKIAYYQSVVKVKDTNGNDMILDGFDSKVALQL